MALKCSESIWFSLSKKLKIHTTSSTINSFQIVFHGHLVGDEGEVERAQWKENETPLSPSSSWHPTLLFFHTASCVSLEERGPLLNLVYSNSHFIDRTELQKEKWSVQDHTQLQQKQEQQDWHSATFTFPLSGSLIFNTTQRNFLLCVHFILWWIYKDARLATRRPVESLKQ